jgi:hypothetical protein
MRRFWTRRRSEFPSHIILVSESPPAYNPPRFWPSRALASFPLPPCALILSLAHPAGLSFSLHPLLSMANPPSLSHFVRMSAVDDLSYPLACDDRTRDAVNTIVSGRKSWKTLKGKGEAVWPPYLEAALIEGPPTPPLPSSPAYPPSSLSTRQIPSRDFAFDPLAEQVPESQSLHLGLHLPCHW